MQSLAARVWDNLPDIERKMLTQEQAECPVYHRFGPGIYIREVHMAAGTFAIGHHQNFEHVNVFLKGRVTILQEDGTTAELQAPMFYVGQPGRKVGYIHEDLVWMNVYATEETDIEKLEAHFLTKSEHFEDMVGFDSFKRIADREDYAAFLEEYGLNADDVRTVSEDDADATALPLGSYKIQVGPSEIEGKGLLATADIKAGEPIGPARLLKSRTVIGRYTNHAKEPNARMALHHSDVFLFAVKDIKGKRGGQYGEEITVDYRQVLNEVHSCQV